MKYFTNRWSFIFIKDSRALTQAFLSTSRPKHLRNLIPQSQLIPLNQFDIILRIKLLIKGNLIIKLLLHLSLQINLTLIISNPLLLLLNKLSSPIAYLLSLFLQIILVTFLDNLVQISQLKHLWSLEELWVWNVVGVFQLVQGVSTPLERVVCVQWEGWFQVDWWVGVQVEGAHEGLAFVSLFLEVNYFFDCRSIYLF